LFEMLLHTAGKSFQGTDECLDHAANSNSVFGLASIIPDFQARGIAISQKFEWMSYVASTARTGVFNISIPAQSIIYPEQDSRYNEWVIMTYS